PVVMISSLTDRGAATTLRALELGAVDFVTKPQVDVQTGTAEIEDEIIRKVKGAARARIPVQPRTANPGAAAAAAGAAPKPPVSQVRESLLKSARRVVAIGASTGGTEALREVICALPPDSPGVVVVQHMPARFTASFAQRLDSLAAVRVT